MSADLSVAIIFKNEIRCLERCLKSLQPLRERLSLEIVMADTGSDDGSRAVAERYADVLFDFPWINDFAAARNAVLERCTGRWVLSIDCDEWLDRDMGDFAEYLCDLNTQQTSGVLMIRNYVRADLAEYRLQYALRMMRMSARPHYVGAIHEWPELQDEAAREKEVKVFMKPFLHHDGYVALNNGSEEGKAKRARNMALLREEFEKDPEDLRTLQEMLDVCDEAEDGEDIIRRAVACVSEKRPGWEIKGPGILSSAIGRAAKRKLPEVKEWAALAEQMFPESDLTKLDVNYQMLYVAIDNKAPEEAIRYGEAYLRAWRKRKRGGKIDLASVWSGSLATGSDASAQTVRVSLANQYAKMGNYELAYARLRELDFSSLNERAAGRALRTVAWLCVNTDLELELLIRSFWDGVCAEGPNETAMVKRLQGFFEEAFSLFNVTAESAGQRPAWQIFLPLAGKSILGDAAELMSAETPEEADVVLAHIDNVASLPPAAFLHAVKLGAAFPIPGKPLTIEDADTLAMRLVTDKQFLREAAIFASSAAENEQDLIWARALALAAAQSNDWETDADPQALLAALVWAESVFLAHDLGSTAQAPEDMPPMHRFALHLANAYAVLFPGTVLPEFKPDVSEGVRGALAELKAAALSAPEQKKAIDWVLDEILRTNQ